MSESLPLLFDGRASFKRVSSVSDDALLILPSGSALEWHRYQMARPVFAVKVSEPFEVQNENDVPGRWGRGKEGDYLCVGYRGELFACPAWMFTSLYRLDEEE